VHNSYITVILNSGNIHVKLAVSNDYVSLKYSRVDSHLGCRRVCSQTVSTLTTRSFCRCAVVFIAKPQILGLGDAIDTTTSRVSSHHRPQRSRSSAAPPSCTCALPERRLRSSGDHI